MKAYLETVALVLALPATIFGGICAYYTMALYYGWKPSILEGSEMATEPGKSKARIATLGIISLLLFATSGWGLWNLVRPDGFKEGWPDAVECSVALPGITNESDQSPLIFYFNGIRRGHNIVSPVYGYFLPGGYNIDNIGYIVHEFWFREDGTMVRPKDLGVDEAKFYFSDHDEHIDPKVNAQNKVSIVNAITKINGTERHYILGFLNPTKCGNSIKDMRGFTFARPLK